MENKKVSNLRLWIILGVLIVCLGTSVAFFTVGYDFNGSGTKVEGETGDFVEVTYDAGTSTLNLQDAVPGSSTTKDFSVKITPNKTKDEVTYDIKLNLTTNEFSYGTEHLQELKYTLTEKETGKVYEGYIPLGTTGDITLKQFTKQEDAETTYNYSLKIEFLNVDEDQNHNQNKSISGNLKVEFTEKDLTVSDILAKYTKDDSRSGQITASFTGNTPTTVYSAADDDGTSYMFAGVNPNNWVKIGSMYFRIIRFNGDGTMRLIYSGARSPETSGVGTQIGYSAFNSNSNDNAYVGFMYGSTGSNTYAETHANTNSSTIKVLLDKWYTWNIAGYTSIIDTNAGFCGDRKESTVSRSGYGTNTTAYITTDRYYDSNGNSLTTFTPSLKCSSNDLYTKVGASKGNKALTNPIGLITADEYALAGGGVPVTNYSNTTLWLHTGETYWTMSPSDYSDDRAYVFDVYSPGYLAAQSVNFFAGVRPVINLKSSTNFLSGDYDGSAEKPWTVDIPDLGQQEIPSPPIPGPD